MRESHRILARGKAGMACAYGQATSASSLCMLVRDRPWSFADAQFVLVHQRVMICGRSDRFACYRAICCDSVAMVLRRTEQDETGNGLWLWTNARSDFPDDALNRGPTTGRSGVPGTRSTLHWSGSTGGAEWHKDLGPGLPNPQLRKDATTVAGVCLRCGP
jgi:hypothetical protein